MGGKGNAGGSTPFEGMSHEDMLAWLDQANSGTVQGAADRLAAAAKEIRKIAEDLKVRPQWVEWKGAGADAFRTWSADLANATLRLGDFSAGSSTWLGHASDAIASAQAAIPRDKAGAQGNLDAARAAHNDPDAAAISRKSAGELAALAADKEKVRQEAVAQMRKLGQAYQQSATQMNGLERPKFPPPPQAIAPRTDASLHTSVYNPGSSGTAEGASSSDRAALGRSAQAQASTSASADPGPHSDPASPVRPALTDTQQPAQLDIDSLTPLPQAAPSPSPAESAPGLGHANTGESPAVRMSPPVFGGGLSVPPGATDPGWLPARERPLVPPGQTASGRSSVRMPDNGSGIVGGRPVPPGRSNGSMAKGIVVGGEDAGGHAAVRPVTGAGPAGQAVGRPGAISGRGSLPPHSGVTGGSAQQMGRAAGLRSVSSGAAAERGGISGGKPIVGNPGGGVRGGPAPRDAQKSRSRREGAGGSPGYLVEDDETWLQADRRAVPPVID
ncbi:translation initiation factor IF-2 [Streptomyces violascens]|uniref:translation initiation factor IF-2 n=1 Tax=Streptomyces violascens TaxID=67381 RepID=UPI00365E2380